MRRGRTGKLFAYEHYGVVPGHHGGRPRALAAASRWAPASPARKRRPAWSIGTHGSTYGGNPLACAAGQAVLDIVANEEFLADVRRMGERLRCALEQMIPNHDHLFESVRGVGLMLGVKMKTDSRAFVNYLRTRGLLTVAAGDNVMRVLPPLIIEEAISASSSSACRRRRAAMRCRRRPEPFLPATPVLIRGRGEGPWSEAEWWGRPLRLASARHLPIASQRGGLI